MSEAKWSPEPWRAVNHTDVDGAGPFRWAIRSRPGSQGDVNGVCGFAIEADARRIVACVNALAGIPTDRLEKGYLGNLLDALTKAGNEEARHEQTASENLVWLAFSALGRIK